MIAVLAEDMAAPNPDTPLPAAPEETDDEMPMAIAAAAHSDADESDLADNNEDDVAAIEVAPSPEAKPFDDDIAKQLMMSDKRLKPLLQPCQALKVVMPKSTP